MAAVSAHRSVVIAAKAIPSALKLWVLAAAALTALALAPNALAAPGDINTFAGTGCCGSSGDGGPATSAQLNGVAVNGVAVDASGNVYIADLNSRVRKVDSSGTITTVAGMGTNGFSGDGGPATSAELNGPEGPAVDASGNLYFADSGNSRVRKVDASGTITTVAGTGTAGFSGDGGPATSAELNYPFAVAVDGAGNLYIADRGDNRVRKVDASGTITTVAGTGTAGFSGDGGRPPRPSSTIPRGGCRRRRQPLHRRPEQQPGAQGGRLGDDHHGRGHGHARLLGRRGPGHLGRPQQSRWRGARQLRQPLYRRRANTECARWTARARSPRWRAAATSGFAGDGGPATSAKLACSLGVALDGSGNLYIADALRQQLRVRKVEGRRASHPPQRSTPALRGRPTTRPRPSPSPPRRRARASNVASTRPRRPTTRAAPRR